MCYPSYTMQRTRPMFSDRQQVLAYEAALTLAAQVDTALEVRLVDGWVGEWVRLITWPVGAWRVSGRLTGKILKGMHST